jgi:hypothetical protein
VLSGFDRWIGMADWQARLIGQSIDAKTLERFDSTLRRCKPIDLYFSYSSVADDRTELPPKDAEVEQDVAIAIDFDHVLKLRVSDDGDRVCCAEF